MNISKHCKRNHLFPQRQIDALGAERIATMIRSDDILGVDSIGSLFGRSPSRNANREHQRRCNRTCIAPLSQREGRVTRPDCSSVRNSNVTSSPFSRQEILAQTQEEQFSSSASSRDNDDDAIDPSLSALLDEIMSDEI